MVYRGDFFMDKDMFPDVIYEYIKNMVLIKDEIGCSNATIFCFKDHEKELYLKIEKKNEEFEREQKCLDWLKTRLPVPNIVARYNYNGYDYLLMTKAVGEMACTDKFLKNPEGLVMILAEGIKQLQNVDISNCPFDCTIDYKLTKARERIENNLIDMSDWEENSQFDSPEELYEFLVKNKPNEELVFSHGDYCLPNLFIENGVISGFIDLGRSGIADKWQDIALCKRSLEHNYRSSIYSELLFKYLDVKPDYEKIQYYILLDELF